MLSLSIGLSVSLLTTVAALASSSGVVDESPPAPRRTTSQPPPLPLLSLLDAPISYDLPSLPSIFAPSSDVVKNPKCRSDARLFLESLSNASLWALKMFEASAKMPTGFFFGSTYQMGNFDECVSVEAYSERASRGGGREEEQTKTSGDGDAKRRFSGKYCLATIRIPEEYLPEPSTDKRSGTLPVGEEIWAKIKETILNPWQNRLNEVHWAICMPSSCSSSDLEAHIRHVIPKFGDLKSFGVPISELRVEVKGNACSSNDDDTSFTKGQTAMLSLIIFLAILLVCGTTLDFVVRKCDKKCNGYFAKFLLCFSIRINFKKLNSDYKPDSPLRCLSGMKAISMVLIIFGHRLLFSLGGPINNTEYVEKRYKRVETAIVLGGLIVVDTFYLISGFLLCYSFLLESHRLKNIGVLFYVLFRRYVRLTPLYMFIVAFYATLYIKTGSGPFWNLRIGMERDRCLQNWWTNLLYINTIVNPEEMCIIQSWYVTSDMHLFIISVPVVYLITKKPTAGKIVLTILFIGGVLTPFFVTYYKELEPLVYGYIENVTDISKYVTFKKSYIQTYMRGTPYFMGLGLGCVLHHIKTHEVKIARVWVHIISVLAFVMAFLPILVASLFYQPTYQYDALTAAIYASLQRVIWGIGMSFCILACFLEKEWFLIRCLSWSMFKPLSKLTYTTYLIHAAIQIYAVGALQNPQYMTVFTVLQQSLGDIAMALFFAVILCMLIEAPLLGIEKLIFRDGKSAQSHSSPEQKYTKKPDEKV